MNWILAAAAPALLGIVFLAARWIHPAILAYHLLCAAAIWRQRARVRSLLRPAAGWTAGTTLVILGVLALAPLIQDPAPYRSLFVRTMLPGERPGLLFALFAAYSMIVHVPLEEIFWRGVVMDPERSPARVAISGSALFFYLLHALPMTILLGARGLLLAAPAFAAGAAWAFVAIRSRSLWPGLVSHWGADAAILGGMWFFFIR